jgi:uncharacterized small protein (DUF1192 family)
VLSSKRGTRLCARRLNLYDTQALADGASRGPNPAAVGSKGQTMSNGSLVSLAELERRMAIVRENIRQLIEQAAGYSGAEDEERNADRIAQQTAELERLTKERDELAKKK